jgi:predicted SnoaL-like aldol condensation-catalyzing enzyme
MEGDIGANRPVVDAVAQPRFEGNHGRYRRDGGFCMSRAVRTAREVVELYNLVVWNERNLELADELLGDFVVRHEVGEAHTLTQDEAVQRAADHWKMFDKLRFELNLVVAGDDGEHVAIVYQSPMTLKDGTEATIGSMEVFRVIDGRITAVWNCGYRQGVCN